MYAWLPILNSGTRVHQESAGLGIDIELWRCVARVAGVAHQVCDKVMRTCRCKVTLRVNGEVWVITLVGKEGCNAGSGTWSIFVCKIS